jgi:hypothetical protein
MTDAIMDELWSIKDSLARENGYDLDRLIAHLGKRRARDDRRVVDLSEGRRSSEQDHPADLGR